MDTLDRRRFRSVYDDAFPVVYAYLARRVGDRDATEDLVQETFMAAVKEAEQGRLEQVTVPWLLGVARHKLADHWRRHEQEERRLARWRAERRTSIGESPGERVLGALDALPPAQRAAIVLHYLDDVPVSDVAGMLGKSVAATESLLARGRHSFRLVFGEEDVDA